MSQLVRCFPTFGGMILLAVMIGGCGSSSDPQSSVLRHDDAVEEARGLLERAVSDLQNPELYNYVRQGSDAVPEEVLENEQARRDYWSILNQKDQELFYWELGESRKTFIYRNNPETLDAVVDRLNQWMATRGESEDPWRPDPLWESIPEHLKKHRLIFGNYFSYDPQRDAENREPNNLYSLEFRRLNQFELLYLLHDGWALQEIVWLRDLGDAVIGKGVSDPVEQTRRMFDWIVRNIHLIPGHPDDTEMVNGQRQFVTPPCAPWLMLLRGRAHAEERAWLLMLLARQQRLPVVMLGYPDSEAPAGIRPWLPALWHEGEFYLFEPRLGVPVPGPNGEPIATLSQVKQQPELLQSLAIEGEAPKVPENWDRLTALIEGSPVYFLRRMDLLESQLGGADRLVLAANASQLAEQLQQHPQIVDVQLYDRLLRVMRHLDSRELVSPQNARQLHLYDIPFREYPACALWSARVMHLKGFYSVDVDRPDTNLRTGGEMRYHVRQGANQLYAATRKIAASMLPVARHQFQQTQQGNDIDARNAAANLTYSLQRAMEDTNYWLGLVAYERALNARPERQKFFYELAAEFLTRDVVAQGKEHPWYDAAQYNLGRIYEALGQPEKAIEHYQQDQSATRPASLLRVQRLQETQAK